MVKKKEFPVKFNISDEFMFHKEYELICNENGFDTTRHSDKEIPVTLGNWAYLIGEAYSGSGVYKTTFTLPDEKVGKESILDLGDVHFTAEVYLNNQLLGTVLMPPYKFKIPAGILAKNNTLKVVVTNTSANWYVHTDYFDRWKTEELSPYFEGEKEYAKDIASGGLYGPITIFFE